MRTILLVTRILFVVLMLSCGVAAVGAVNLTLEKSLVDKSTSDDSLANITWRVNLTNEDPTEIGVNVTEIPPDCEITSNLTSNGTYSNKIWNVTLAANASENLTLTMECSLSCSPTGSVKVENTVEITSPDSDKNASANVTFTVPVCPRSSQNITVKPETMNAKTLNLSGKGASGKGIATVFIKTGDLLTRGFDEEDISIKCNNAEPEKIKFNNKDNGTLILKFRRSAFEFDNPVEDTAWINCSGAINLSDGTVLNIQGGDEIRIVNPSLFVQFLQFLGIAHDEDDLEEEEEEEEEDEVENEEEDDEVEEEDECMDDDDCEEERNCIQGECEREKRIECSEDEDCDEDESCEHRKCRNGD